MTKGVIFKILTVIFILLIINTNNIYAEEEEITAKSAILIDQNTGRILYEKNIDEKLPMASTTKVMTAIIALEYGESEDIVIIDNESPFIEGSSIYLKDNDKISLNDLIYGLMLRSGNDAADAIAKHIGNTRENFLSLMNEKAKVIGATNSNFTNSHGLHNENHYTTAYDLAMITRYGFNNNRFVEIISSQKKEITINDNKRIIYNKNKLLTNYEGGNGVKTGYTKAAGKCLVFSAERNGLQLIGVILDSYNIWTDSNNLLNYGFENYENVKVLNEGEYIASLYVKEGINDKVNIYCDENIIIPLSEEEISTLGYELVKEDFYLAPIFNKQELCKINFLLDKEVIYTKTLYSSEKIYRKNFIEFLLENIKSYCKMVEVDILFNYS